MFPTNTSPFAGLVKVILVLVIIGVLVGLVLSGSDLTNFVTNRAKAKAITQQNDIQAQKDAMDLENYQSVQDIITKTKIEQILADSEIYKESLKQNLQLQAQKAAQELKTDRLISYFLIGAGALVSFCLGIGIVILMIQVGHSRVIAMQKKVKQADKWQDPLWRRQQIKISRQRERVMLETRTRQASKSGVPVFYPDETLIPWEDLQKQFAEMG